MNLNRKYRAVAVCVLIVLLGSNQASAYNKYKWWCLVPSAGVLILSSVYYALYSPYESTHAAVSTNQGLSVAVNAIYNNTIVNAKKYDEIPSIASHNSFTYSNKKTNSWSPQPVLFQNQILSIVEQLDFGVRTFLIDLYIDKSNPNAPIEFSHAMGGRALTFTREWVSFLKEIKDFLDNHPNEIIMLCLESYVEDYNRIMQDLIQIGLDKLIYVIPNGQKDWDTRNQMIQNNKRLIIFSDASKDEGLHIMNARYYMLENHYDKNVCEHRPFQRLKVPQSCTNSIAGTYNCIKQNMHSYGSGSQYNDGAIIFLLNHFSEQHYNKLKRLFPKIFGDIIEAYFSVLNSYAVIRDDIRSCYCEFKLVEESCSSHIKITPHATKLEIYRSQIDLQGK